MPATSRRRCFFPPIYLAIVTLSFLSTVPAATAADEDASKTPAGKPRPRVTISKETTVITELLRDDGYPDYLRHLNEKLSRGVTPDNNAMVALLEAIGPAAINDDVRQQYFALLGIPPLAADGAFLEHWREFAWRVPENERPKPPADYEGTAEDYFFDLDSLGYDRPWTAKEFPHLARWLGWQNKHIDMLVTASKRPRFYAPFVSDAQQPSLSTSNTLLANNLFLQSATWLLQRAMFRAGEKKIAGAIDDIFAVRRLARLLASRPTLADHLTGLSIESMARGSELVLLQDCELSREQLTTLRQLEKSLPPFPPVFETLDAGERLWFADAVCVIAENGSQGMKQIMWSQTLPGPVAVDPSLVERAFDLLVKVGVDWDVPLRMGNEWYDRGIAIGKIDDPLKKRAAIETLDHDAKQLVLSSKELPSLGELMQSPRKAASRRMASALVAIFGSAITGTYNAENRTHTRQKLLRLAIALHEFRAEHGNFPMTLKNLKGKDVETVPVDDFTAAPFIYKPSDKGYLLYSLGENGRDDRAEYNGDDADDIALRLPRE